jgi:hypothetical protein
MLFKIIAAVAACDWLMATDSYGHQVASFVVRIAYKAFH